MSQTASVVIAEGIRHEELSAVQDDGVVLDRLHEGGDVASAESSNTDSGETLDENRNADAYPSTDPVR